MDRIYSKDSFDRFGDDLAEVLMSCLPLVECFRFECLSKQWQRLVFNRQHVHSIDDNSSVNVSALETIAKKCPHIQRIHITDNEGNRPLDPMFVLITRHSTRVTALIMKCQMSRDLHVKTMIEFLSKFGAHLKTIDMTLTTILVNDRDQYALMSINVKIDGNPVSGDHSYVKPLMTGLSRMIALKDLGITYETSDQSLVRQFVVKFTPIGAKCQSLKSLAFSLDISDVNVMRDLWRVFNEKFAKRLTRLTFRGNYPEDWELMDESFTAFKRLKYLSIDCKESLFDYKFDDKISGCLPRLQYLSIETTVISDQALRSLSVFTKIETIRLNGTEEFTQSCVENLMEKCLKIKEIVINDKKMIPN